MVPRISLASASKPADLLCEGQIDIFSPLRDYDTSHLESYLASDVHITASPMNSFSVARNFEEESQHITLICTGYPSSICSSLDSIGTLRGSPSMLSTPSRHSTDPLVIPSPTPLPQTPTPICTEFSPPVGVGGTPFEQQFTAHLSSRWNTFEHEISPVTRRTSLGLSQDFGSPVASARDPTTSRTSKDVSHWGAQCQERVSLMDKFLSVAPRALPSCEEFQTFFDLDLQKQPSSPVSEVSSLTPLSTPEISNRRRQSSSRSTPPTSPTMQVSGHTANPNFERFKQAHADLCLDAQPRQDFPGPYFLDRRAVASDTVAGFKRRRSQHPTNADSVTDSFKTKKARISKIDEATHMESVSTPNIPTTRRLPTDIPYHPQFPLFYRRFPVSSYFLNFEEESSPLEPQPKHPGGIYNPPRGAHDLYTPRYVKGCGTTKVGLCPICIESTSRGGLGQKVWLSMKFSAYNYHLQYGHGISAASTRPFSPPVAFRSTERRNAGKHERTVILEGKCHKCKKWIPIESMKDVEIKVKELYWWKHAATCHQGTQIPGDDDFFEDDDIYRHVQLLAL
ncbi:hypothetical protein F5I97DRAFT_1022652 [Phlebopus sp. FC_14]|nr:hypothetical protein F5I97DRAFT_1022652 [Phlebopus sp. FC_14]